MKRSAFLLSLVFLFGLLLFQSSCRNIRIKDHQEWGQFFNQENITEAGFEIYDNNKEIASYYNKERVSTGYPSGAVFDLFVSLSALSSNIALNDKFRLPVASDKPADTLTLAEAFRSENRSYFDQLSELIGQDRLQKDLDTIQLGNKRLSSPLGASAYDGSLLVTPDEWVGFMKNLYHGEMEAFDQRTMRIVRKLMLQDTAESQKLYYRFAEVPQGDSSMYLLVGIFEHYNALKNSKTKVLERIPHPYFFSMNFTVPKDRNSEEVKKQALSILNRILNFEHDKV